MEAAAHHCGEFIALADAADIGRGQHEGLARLRVGDGIDAADLRALFVGRDEVFFVLWVHGVLSVSGAGIFRGSAPTRVLYIRLGGCGVYGSWSGVGLLEFNA